MCVCLHSCACEHVQYKCCWVPHVHKQPAVPVLQSAPFTVLTHHFILTFLGDLQNPIPYSGCWHLFWFSHLGICICNRISQPVRSPEFGLKMRLASCQVGFPGTFPAGLHPTPPPPTLTKGHSGYCRSLEDHNSRVGSPSTASSRNKWETSSSHEQVSKCFFTFPPPSLYGCFFFLCLFFLFMQKCLSTRKQRIRWMRKRSNLMPKKQDKIATSSKMPPKFV